MVTAPELARHARRAADLAGRLITLMHEVRGEGSAQGPFDTELPPSAQAHAEGGTLFNTEMTTLKDACPAA